MQSPGGLEQPLVKVVVRYLSGKVVKGLTNTFTPLKDRFQIVAIDYPGAAQPEILVRDPDMKGIFFVKDLDGDLGHAKSNIFDPLDTTPGCKIRILFTDGEELLGFSPDYLPGKAGFYVLPADLNSNADRCFIVTSATQSISRI